MIKKQIAKEISVSPIGLGTMGLGGYFKKDDSRDGVVVQLINEALDLGMNLIDTAEVYGAGHCEELIGKAVKSRRKEAFITTKFSPENNDKNGVHRSVEASLKRLATDYIDLLLIHWPNPSIALQETADAMSEEVKKGRIRFLGCSNYREAEVRKLKVLLGSSMIAVQDEYNLFDRCVERSVIPYCESAGLMFMAYSPLLQGRMAGNDRRKNLLEQLAAKYELSVSQIVLSWLARFDSVVPIPKVSSLSHLKQNASSLDKRVAASDLQAISDSFTMKIEMLAPTEIQVAEVENRNAYKTVEEALANRLDFVPSPAVLAEDLRGQAEIKPVKVVRNQGPGPRYLLKEGRIRYWAWVIAHKGSKPVPCLVEE